MADEYHGAPGQSSIKLEGNLAPYKPKTDIHINAISYPPHGQASTEWTCGVRVGDRAHDLTITGPRYYRFTTFKGWHHSDPVPIASLPIRYEQAFGGTTEDGKVCEENPIGTGYADFKSANLDKPIAAPQILPLGSKLPPFGQAAPVAGLGPLAPAWKPRRDKAGTFNVAWEKSRWPDLPVDFKFDFYNSSASGLLCPKFLIGNEWFSLSNLTKSSQLRFQLPNYELGLLLRLVDGRMLPAPCRLDTVHIEPSDSKVYLVWRGVFPIDQPIRVLEVRMRTADDRRLAPMPPPPPPSAGYPSSTPRSGGIPQPPPRRRHDSWY